MTEDKVDIQIIANLVVRNGEGQVLFLRYDPENEKWWLPGGDVTPFTHPDEARDKALAESDRVQQEDIAICDRVQAGLDSGVYDRGVYAPSYETPMYHFHQMLARDLRAATGL